jgi:hypothetical protein
MNARMRQMLVGSVCVSDRRPPAGTPNLRLQGVTGITGLHRVLEDLQRLLEPATVGNPMRPLMWVSKSHVEEALACCGAVSIGCSVAFSEALLARTARTIS